MTKEIAVVVAEDVDGEAHLWGALAEDLHLVVDVEEEHHLEAIVAEEETFSHLLIVVEWLWVEDQVQLNMDEEVHQLVREETGEARRKVEPKNICVLKSRLACNYTSHSRVIQLLPNLRNYLVSTQ